MTVGWLDCASGVSGDMLLGALTHLGVLDPVDLAQRVPVDVTCTVQRTVRAGLAATQVSVAPGGDQPHRRLVDILAVIGETDVPQPAKERAAAVFRRLAAAESQVHGVGVDDIEFHEVGAVDAIVDVLGACVGLHRLELDRFVVSPIALGGGTVSTEHGALPVPGPAVLQLLAATDLSAHGGPADRELATPTGVAVVAEWAHGSGLLPELQVRDVGIGAGARDDPDRPNVVRLVVGAMTGGDDDTWLLLESNVDDLDPRLWPVVIQRLLAAGAADAWLTPIVMKKGRPALTLSALTSSAHVAAVQSAVFAETSAIGLRTIAVGKHALDREWISVVVEGQSVRVKLARSAGAVVNAVPEFDDVVLAAEALGRPVKTVLAAAIAAAERSGTA